MLKKVLSFSLSFMMAVSAVASTPFMVQAESHKASVKSNALQTVTEVKVDANKDYVVWVTFGNKMKAKVTFLDNNIFRYNIDPSNEFSEYAKVRSGYPDTAKIQQYPDDSKNYAHPAASVTKVGAGYEIKAGDVTIAFDETAKMTVKAKDKVVMQEKEPLTVGSSASQTIVKNNAANEQFFGGGTQNGRIIHTGKTINIANESGWNDGQVSSPNPFYYTTNGYGVLRNTYQSGSYDFGSNKADTVRTTHSENEFDAYYFVTEKTNNREVVQDLLNGYFKVTGNPVLLPEYGFYLGHLNAYNRDAWSATEKIGKGWEIKGNKPHTETGEITYERGGTGTELRAGETAETLNGYGPTVSNQNVPAGVLYSEQFSARGVLNQYVKYDMPLGFFLPNDGYGAGYGQNGFKVTGGVNPDGTSNEARLAAVAANVANLKDFADYAQSKGIATGLWTQSQLVPDSNANTPWHLLRDFENEVRAGVTTLKTDVAWVGPGYSFQLSGVKQAYDIVTAIDYKDDRDHTRPNIISLDGWAGSQRYNSVWTGDQTGGNWEYIRFHIPTFIGQGLAGNPNIGTDMDGIWGGNPVIATRDYQWKSFAPQMLDMDGWGTYAKKPFAHGDPYTGVSRMYLKIKSMLMPYTYTNAYAAANIDTGNNDKGLPMIRAMFLEYPNDPVAYSDLVKYQYMYGENLLVAPIYQNTDQDQDTMNDRRDGIYLPDANQTWVDYFTGEQYRGGKFLNNFDAPLWKLPLFVKNGAIIPMVEANNSAYKMNKTNRLVEFWPEGSTDFTAIEDNGTYIENKLDKSNKEYGVIDNVSYGPHVSTTYTSKVENGTATLTANKATGSYKGYDQNKNTTFIVHVSKAPTSLVAKNGSANLNEVKVDSKEAFDSAKVAEGTFVSFYDAAPKVETFASAEETILADMVKNVKVAPKLYVKFAKTDSQANAQTLVINGFENDGNLNGTQLNKELLAPEQFKELADLKTPTSVTLGWVNNPAATEYEILVDGTFDGKGVVTSGSIYSVPKGSVSFTHVGIPFLSTHTYYIRSLNKDGHSAWSAKVEATSADDPYCDTPDPKKISWTGQVWGNHKADLAFDKIFQSGDGGFHSDHGGVNEHLTIDYGFAYLFDYIEFYPRSDAGNGTPENMFVETSLDGVHWIQHGNKLDKKGNKYFACQPDASMKTIDLSDPFRTDDKKSYIGARYIRFTPTKTVGTFFSASEIKPYLIAGADNIGGKNKPFRVGKLLTQGTDKPDLDNFKSIFLKESSAHKNASSPQWVGEMRDTYVDINYNNMSDIWDYTFNGFEVDRGSVQTPPVEGRLVWKPSANTVKAGETFTIQLNVTNGKNIEAFGGIINYNPKKLEYVGVETIYKGFLYTDGLTASVTNEDGSTYINHGAMFLGCKYVINGNQTLSTITLRAKEDITLNNVTNVKDPEFIIDLNDGIIIGGDHSFITAEKVKDADSSEKVMQQDEFNLTMTNAVLPTDDGTNITKIVQNGSYDGLFNGSQGRDFEFKWDVEGNHVDGKLPAHVSLPATLHMNLKTPKYITTVKVYNANKANGYLTAAKAQVTYEDETTGEELVINNEKAVYDFVFNTTKKVKNIDVTFMKAINGAGAEVTNMLTLSEIEVGARDVLSSVEKLSGQSFTPTITNALLPTDDGTNVTKLVQQQSYDSLFNGTQGREFEFKWDIASNHVNGKLPDYVTLPATLHLQLAAPKYIKHVDVYNANKSNGYLTSAKAKVTYTDDTESEELLINKEQAVYKFNFNTNKPVKAIDITFLTSTGATSDGRTNAMLTLSEIEVFGSDTKDVTEKPVEKDVLKHAVFNAKGMNEAIYTKDSYDALQAEITKAEALIENEKATQEQVNAALNAVVNKANSLVLKPADYRKVDAAIAKANALNKADYEDFTKVDAAIAAVVRGKDITKQAEVDAMATAIEKEISKLVMFTMKPVGMSVTLNENIAMNIYLNVSATTAKDDSAYVLFSVEGSEQTRKVMVKDFVKQENGTYKVSMPLFARQMNDVVTMQMHTENGDLDAYTYTIVGYAQKVLEKADATEAQKAAVRAMLDYGATSQTYFKYKVDQLANASLTNKDYQSVTVDTLKPYAHQVTDNVTGVQYGASNLRLVSETAMRHHFVVDPSVKDNKDITFVLVDAKGKETALTPTFYNGDRAYVEINSIFAENLDNMYTVKVKDAKNQTELTVTYSVFSYGYAILNKADASAEIKDVVKAMYNYNQCAKAYKASLAQ